MTKAQEIETLRQAASTLGPDSYCGPWLLSVLAEVESDIRSDLGPFVTFATHNERAKQILVDAANQAENLRREGHADATRERQAARDFSRTVRENLASTLRQMLKTTEGC